MLVQRHSPAFYRNDGIHAVDGCAVQLGTVSLNLSCTKLVGKGLCHSLKTLLSSRAFYCAIVD